MTDAEPLERALAVSGYEGGPPVVAGLSAPARAEIRDRWEISRDKWASLVAARELSRTGEQWPWACVYVTGSLAREEAFDLSDLDLFIINMRKREPTRVEAASLVAALDRARTEAGFEPFSDGGAYLEPHSFRKMRLGVGSPHDDATNRFTARMLLLLNSKCLLNEKGYHRARAEILELYWRDCPDEHRPYVPLFLMNDIRRHWLTMCLNFEQKNPPKKVGPFDSRSDGKRRIANLKLRTARLLDSYTPILGLLHSSDSQGISRVNAWQVFDRTPLERLRDIAMSAGSSASEIAVEVMEHYAAYLLLMQQTEDILQKKFGDDDTWNAAKNQATQIGDSVARLIEILGDGKALYRFAVV